MQNRDAFLSLPVKRLRVLPALVMMVALLAGCWPLSDSGQPGSQAESTPTSVSELPGATGNGSETPAPGVTSLPRGENALNIAGGIDDPPSLDPALANDAYSGLVIRQLFSGLVAFDDNLNVVPDIAAALPSISPDGKTYTFALRKGVRFTDGTEVTASDFKYSMERAADPQLAGPQSASSLPAALFLGDIVGVRDRLDGKTNTISGIQAPDPYTLVINIDAPKAYFLSKLTSGPAYVVEQANVKEGPNWTEKPRGTGPFRLEKWVHKAQMVLAANPSYYGGKPALDTVNIWMGSNATGTLQQYESREGNLDVTNVGVDDIERVSDRNNPLSKQLQTVPDMSVTYVAFNLRQKPFDDPKIREAISLVVDRQKIARVMFQSRVRQAQGFVPPDLAGYTPPDVGDTYDVTRARQLVAESTYKDAKNLPRLRLYTSGDLLGPMLRDVLTQTLGIDLEVHEVEWSDYLDGLDRREYPMFTLEWGADFPDPESILGSLFRSNSPENHTGYNNPDVDAALNTAAVESDRARRMATYAQVEERILKDYPAVPIYHSVQYTLVKPYVKGLKVTPMGILSLKNVRLER